MKSFDINKFAQAICHDERTLEMFRYFVNNSYLRVVRYYNTSQKDKKRLEAEIQYFSRYFSPVTLEDVAIFFETRKWRREKPGLLPCIMEGYRSHHDVMLPILEKYGFTGWFFVPACFPDVPVEEQLEYGKQHDLLTTDTENYPDGRIAMNWEEVRTLSWKHEICCHTCSNARILPDTSDEELRQEILYSKSNLESHIQKPVEVFHWLSAEEFNYNVRAHRMMEQAGYQYVLSNLKLEKIR